MSFPEIYKSSYTPIMMSWIMNYDLPSCSQYYYCTFIARLRVVCQANKGTDPIMPVTFVYPPAEDSYNPIPTTGCFILTLIGKWYEIRQWNYSELQYTVTHIHDNDKNDKATFNALQEMNQHLNACFRHPAAQKMIKNTNGSFSGACNTITFGLVIDADGSSKQGKITYVNPSKEQIDITNSDPFSIPTPSIGWLCLFGIWGGSYDYYPPVVDLSSHTQFMKTYNPNDLPPAEAFAYRALIDKWNNEPCKKEISSHMPKPNELNPYTYLEAWNGYIEDFYDIQQQIQIEKAKTEQEKEINTKAQECFEEYKRLFLQQQTLDITSYIQQHAEQSSNTFNIDPSLFTTLSSTLYNEYYAKYLSNQLNDLKIMNHLQYQQLALSLTSEYRHYTYNTRRAHTALPPPSSPSSQIDTLIELATAAISIKLRTEHIYFSKNKEKQSVTF